MAKFWQELRTLQEFQDSFLITWVSDITGAKHLAHTVHNWQIYDGSTTTFLDLNKWRQQGIKVLEGPEGEYD